MATALASIITPDHGAVVDATPRKLWRQAITIEPARFYNRTDARVFRAARYMLRAVQEWRHAVEWVERREVDAVLLDIDAIDAATCALRVSSARLVYILRRAAVGRNPIIAATTRRDFVEIEDVVRAGVDVLTPHTLTSWAMIQRIEAARARRLAHGAGVSG
jgi:hypothetical protein